MGEIHELFVLALSLVWFAGATPDVCHPNSEIHELFVLALSLVWFAGPTPDVCHPNRKTTYVVGVK